MEVKFITRKIYYFSHTVEATLFCIIFILLEFIWTLFLKIIDTIAFSTYCKLVC